MRTTSNLKSRTTGVLTVLLLISSSLAAMAGCSTPSAEAQASQQRLRLATTTSLYDTGLWGHVEPMFEEEYGVELDIL